MQLEPKAKPVRIRIRSCGKEHSTIESLKKSFNYEDILLVNENTLCRWLKQCSQPSIVSEIEGHLEQIQEPEEKGLYIAKVLFEKEAGYSISTWDDMAMFWITREEYVSNVEYVPFRKLTAETLDDARFIPFLKKDSQLLLRKLIANPSKYYYYYDDPDIRNQAQKLLIENAIASHDYEEAIRIGGSEVADTIRYRFFLNQPTEEEKERFDRLRYRVEVWLKKCEYVSSSSLEFNILRNDTKEIRLFYTFALTSINLIESFYTTKAEKDINLFEDKAYRILFTNQINHTFFRYLVLSTIAFLWDNNNFIITENYRALQLLVGIGFSHPERIDFSHLQEQKFRLSGISPSTLGLLYKHDWFIEPIGYKDAIVAILKECFSLYE